MAVITREQWGARHEDGFGPAPEPATEVWLHHTVTVAPDVGWLDANADGLDDSEVKAIRQIEAIGEQRFGRGISYNRLVVPAGRIYEGVSWSRKGAHLAGRNSVARSYALVGNYDVEPVTDAQVDAIARDLVQAWRAGHLDAPVLDGGHGSAPGASTACPGRNGRAAIPRIRERIAWLLMTAPTPALPTPTRRPAMHFARRVDSPAVFVSNGLRRRHVPNPTALAALQEVAAVGLTGAARSSAVAVQVVKDEAEMLAFCGPVDTQSAPAAPLDVEALVASLAAVVGDRDPIDVDDLAERLAEALPGDVAKRVADVIADRLQS